MLAKDLICIKGCLNGHTLFTDDGRQFKTIGYYAFDDEYIYGFFLVIPIDEYMYITRKVAVRIVQNGKETLNKAD